MSAFLVIERPNHGPRVLGAFGSRQAAEEAREFLIAREPKWATSVSIQAPWGNDEHMPRSVVGLLLVALVAVDVVIVYALYLAAGALVDLV
jgi:hypothetical protein